MQYSGFRNIARTGSARERATCNTNGIYHTKTFDHVIVIDPHESRRCGPSDNLAIPRLFHFAPTAYPCLISLPPPRRGGGTTPTSLVLLDICPLSVAGLVHPVVGTVVDITVLSVTIFIVDKIPVYPVIVHVVTIFWRLCLRLCLGRLVLFRFRIEVVLFSGGSMKDRDNKYSAKSCTNTYFVFKEEEFPRAIFQNGS